MSSFLLGENSVFAREIEVMMILYLSEIRSGHAAKVFTELFYDPKQQKKF